ncbi:MAG: sigma-70 family RNA polymerase sigma factor [Myxococcota bacterium]
MKSDTEFERWVIEHHGMVWAVCFAVLRDSATTDEVVQETFLAAYLRRGQLRDRSRSGPWLRRMAQNQAIDRARRCRREADVRAAVRTSTTAAPPSAPEAAIAEAFGSLDDDSRALLLQFHLEGRSTQELATQWGLAEATLRKRLSRARAKLRDEYASQLTRWATPPRRAAAVAAAILGALSRRTWAAGSEVALGTAIVMVLGGLVVFRATTDPAAQLEPAPSPRVVLAGTEPLAKEEPMAASDPPADEPQVDADPELAAFLEAVAALERFEPVDLVTCTAASSLTQWQPARGSRGWTAFRDLRISGSDIVAALAGSRTRIEGTLVLEHVDDATDLRGLRYLLDPSDDGLHCTLVPLAEVEASDLQAFPRREGLARVANTPEDRATVSALAGESEDDEQSLFDAGRHPLQLAAATPGLSRDALGIVEQWLAQRERVLDKLARIRAIQLRHDEVVVQEDGSVHVDLDEDP